MMKDIDADYYGYRDDDDGVLIPLEQEEEKEGERKFIVTNYMYQNMKYQHLWNAQLKQT